VATFDAAVASDPRVERRTLFGSPSAHVGGHLAATVFRDQLVLRLGSVDLGPLHEGRRPQPFEPLPGRPMRELYVVPRGVLADREALDDWVARALGRLAGWPPRGGAPHRRAPARAASTASTASATSSTPAISAIAVSALASATSAARAGDAGQAAEALPGLGPRSREWLARAGIDSRERLCAVGAVGAYVAVRRAGGRPSLNLLWALEGAIVGQRWQDVAREHRTSLLLALEDALAAPRPPAD
jgi:DNA transformation protein